MHTAKRRAVIAAATVLIIAMIACGIGFATRTDEQSPGALLRLGEKYLLEMDYEQALVAFTKLIAIEPMTPRGYTGSAEAYIGLGQPDKALEILQAGYERTGDEGIRAWIAEMGAEPGAVQMVPADASSGVQGQQELSPEAVAVLEQIYGAYLDDNPELCMDLQQHPVILSLYDELPADEHGDSYLYYTHETEGGMQVTLQDQGGLYQIHYSMGIERDVTTRIKAYHDLDSDKQPLATDWHIHTYADGKSTGPYESLRYEYPDGSRELTEIETGDVVDGAYQGEVVQRLFYGGQEQEVIRRVYVDGYVQPAGPPNEDGELPQAVRTYLYNDHSDYMLYLPADDREWSVRRPYVRIGLR